MAIIDKRRPKENEAEIMNLLVMLPQSCHYD
jgi:hypothetical protein